MVHQVGHEDPFNLQQPPPPQQSPLRTPSEQAQVPVPVENVQQNEGAWVNFLQKLGTDRNFQQAIIAGGAKLLQPRAPGQSTAGAIGEGIVTGQAAFRNLEDRDLKRDLAERQQLDRQRRTSAFEAQTQATSSDRQTRNRIAAAKFGLDVDTFDAAQEQLIKDNLRKGISDEQTLRLGEEKIGLLKAQIDAAKRSGQGTQEVLIKWLVEEAVAKGTPRDEALAIISDKILSAKTDRTRLRIEILKAMGNTLGMDDATLVQANALLEEIVEDVETAGEFGDIFLGPEPGTGGPPGGRGSVGPPLPSPLDVTPPLIEGASSFPAEVPAAASVAPATPPAAEAAPSSQISEPTSVGVTATGKPISQESLEHTALTRGISVEEVKRRMIERGATF